MLKNLNKLSARGDWPKWMKRQPNSLDSQASRLSTSGSRSTRTVTSNQKHTQDQLDHWQKEYDVSCRLVKLHDDTSRVAGKTFTSTSKHQHKIDTTSQALENLSYEGSKRISPHSEESTQLAHMDSLEGQARRRVLCDRDTPMSHAGIIQLSLLSNDTKAWPKKDDYIPEGLTDVGRLTSKQIDQHTDVWRKAKMDGLNLISELDKGSRFQFRDAMGTAVAISTIPDLRSEIATGAEKLGFSGSGSSTGIPTKVIDGLAHLCECLDDNEAATPESALSVLKAANKGSRTQGWSIDMKPLESFLETVTEERKLGLELYESCKAYAGMVGRSKLKTIQV